MNICQLTPSLDRLFRDKVLRRPHALFSLVPIFFGCYWSILSTFFTIRVGNIWSADVVQPLLHAS